MKILKRIVGGIFAIILFAISAGWYIFGHYDAGAPPISSPEALSLLNNCYRFTHVGGEIRQATSVTRVYKGSGGADASSDVSSAQIRWRWISGPKAEKSEDETGQAVFQWQSAPDLKNWNFPESQWKVLQFEQSGDEASLDCTAPTLIQ